MLIIVGLGNPGQQYLLNRHNVGFMAIDVIAEIFNASKFKEKFNALYVITKINECDVILLKPQTFMNLSGKSVSAFLNFFKVKIDNLIVIHDDIDLDIGVIKIKRAGGSAGHNGLKSIDACASNDYYRIRVGVSRPIANISVSSYVLSNFLNQEMDIICNTLFNVAQIFKNATDKNKDWLKSL